MFSYKCPISLTQYLYNEYKTHRFWLFFNLVELNAASMPLFRRSIKASSEDQKNTVLRADKNSIHNQREAVGCQQAVRLWAEAVRHKACEAVAEAEAVRH